MSETRPSLKTLFQESLKLKEKLENSTEKPSSDTYKTLLSEAINKFEECKREVNALALFSPNEELEELSTKEIKYLNIEFYLASLYERAFLDRTTRQKIIEQAVLNYFTFLRNCANYNVIPPGIRKRLERITGRNDETDGEDTFSRLNEAIKSTQVTNAVDRRQDKITRHKQTKELKEKIAMLESADHLNLDDETVRNLYVSELQLHILETISALDSLQMELEVLSHAPPVSTVTLADAHLEAESEAVGREKPGPAKPEEYTEKVEVLQKPLLSKEGKVLRPFTLVASRSDVKKNVFGTGQVMPSMSVEEYMEYELQNGLLAKSAPPEEEPDEDDMDAADRETYKKREWDEFTDSHPRGSGNTMNRG